MKIDEKIRDFVVGEIEEQINRKHKMIIKTIGLMRNTTTVEDLMKLKTILLLRIQESFPLGISHCYFCVQLKYKSNPDICNVCKYGKIHGQCPELGSSWRKLKIAIDNLPISDYFQSETYSVDEPSYLDLQVQLKDLLINCTCLCHYEEKE